METGAVGRQEGGHSCLRNQHRKTTSQMHTLEIPDIYGTVLNNQLSTGLQSLKRDIRISVLYSQNYEALTYSDLFKYLHIVYFKEIQLKKLSTKIIKRVLNLCEIKILTRTGDLHSFGNFFFCLSKGYEFLHNNFLQISCQLCCLWKQLSFKQAVIAACELSCHRG